MRAVLPFLIITVLLSILCGVCLGPVRVSPAVTWRVIAGQVPWVADRFEGAYSRLEFSIVWILRLPRVLLGAIVGASLALCGVAMQALVRNRLADPFVLGVSSGASAAATLGMLFGTFRFLGRFSLPLSAFLGAAITITLVYMLSRVDGKINIPQLLLSGVAVSMMMGAVTSIITLSAPNALGLHSVTFWMSGSLAGARWEYLTLPAAVMLVCMTVLLFNYRTLDVLLLGEETAITLGINVAWTQKWLVICASLLAGVTIAVSGTIGFVGLMVPHLSRMIVGASHRRVLPVCVFLGAVLVIWADVAARTALAPEEMPVGLLTSLVGGPFFIMLLKRERKRRAAP